jgi:hypothetical protein
MTPELAVERLKTRTQQSDGAAATAVEPAHVLAQCVPASSNHAFLRAIGAEQAYGYEFTGEQIGAVYCAGAFVIEVVNATGRCVNLLIVLPYSGGDCECFYLPGCPLAGCMTVIGDAAQSHTVVLCAELASGLLIHQSTGLPVAITHFDANTNQVGTELRRADINVELLLAAGVRRAEDLPSVAQTLLSASQSCQSRLVLPRGASTGYPTFAQLFQREGPEAVEAAVRSSEDWNSHFRKRFVEEPRDAIAWPMKVHGGGLIEQLVGYLGTYSVVNPSELLAIALWAICTHLVTLFQTAPILAFLSLTKRCGKTTTVNVLKPLLHAPVDAVDISNAGVYEACNDGNTIVIDEADQFLKESGMTQILNGGHTVGASVRRFGRKRYNIFGFKLISQIGALSETLMDRAVAVRLIRKRANHAVLKFGKVGIAEGVALRSMIEAFVHDCSAEVDAASPLPAKLDNDRAIDNWEPLLKVATAAGHNWYEMACNAAVRLTAADEDIPSYLEEFIIDIVEIFSLNGADFIATSSLLEKLNGGEDRPWSTFSRGKPLSGRDLATLMRQARVRVGEQFNDGTTNVRGYYMKDVQHLIDGYGK